jgi:hypothetical protein
VIIKGLFGSLKAVKDEIGLELPVSYRRCLLFSNQRLGSWYLRRFSILCGSGLRGSCFSCQASWAVGFFSVTWVGSASGGMV